MFYSSQLLSRKTPLGICWLASHSESKRLKRTQIFEFSISQSCDSIINPEAPLALRLSGQLLLGVVRIYQRKLAFLETDAKNAIDGMQRKDGANQNVDLPDGGMLPENAITLPGSDPTLFGARGDLFPSFNMASTPGLGTGRSGSVGRMSKDTDYTMADDISDVFGSTRWTGSEDKFGGSLEQFSTELERLRDAAVVDNTVGDPVFFDQGNDYGPMDDIMEAPGADFFDAPSMLVDPGKTPGSVGQFSDLLKAASGGGVSPMGDLPDISGPIFDGGDDYGGYDDYEPLPPSTPVGKSVKKKKTFHLDVDANGDPATLIDEDEAKRLLRNRASLIKKRGVTSEADVDAALAEKDDNNRLASFAHIAPDISDIINPIIMPPKTVKQRKKPENSNAPAASPFMTDAPPDDQMDYNDGGMDDYGGGDDYGYDDPGYDQIDEMQTPVADVDKAILTEDGFTARTEAVLRQIKSRAEPSPGNKRAHEASSSSKRVSLNSLVQGKSRLEACRWFFESLVLRNKGHVDLEQSVPYGDISIICSEPL